MARTRAHTLRIILFSFCFLGLGFWAGFYGMRISMHKGRTVKGNRPYLLGANTIMTKRMQAIKAARKTGKDEYEFEVKGFYPTLGNKN